ncbi:hypothetical protein T10_5228 [Trichinella papuae]|uniref:Uncharacterized protein n=1 Tax=Trichinella papuae TaxID=268474 RepID=A0A0V1MDF2_9BILA|nr:hypothetical protein T10_5228 [Trichinella papuae]KRZ69951.1 hypothetical protein T10_5228 [Trichinella papuae]
MHDCMRIAYRLMKEADYTNGNSVAFGILCLCKGAFACYTILDFIICLPIIALIRILFFFPLVNIRSNMTDNGEQVRQVELICFFSIEDASYFIQCNICIHRVRSTVDTCTAIPVHHMDLILLESSGEVDWSID